GARRAEADRAGQGPADDGAPDHRAGVVPHAAKGRPRPEPAPGRRCTAHRRAPEFLGCGMATGTTYVADAARYERMPDRRAGRSGLDLPAISLGLWQNFGGERPYETSRAILRRAFDAGITHFDLANNYGPPYGSAEETFGHALRDDLRPYRDELVISTKAG